MICHENKVKEWKGRLGELRVKFNYSIILKLNQVLDIVLDGIVRL